jgi:DNA-binding CsgD family transcriptional regulator
MALHARLYEGDASPPGLSVQRFSEIVGHIYECALTPHLWPAALEEVCEGVGGPAGWIATHEPRLVRSVYEVEAGVDPHWQKRLGEEYVAISPFIGITHHVRPGEVWSVADAIDYDEFLEGRFYREWSEPQGFGDTIMGVLTKDPHKFSWLGVCVSGRASDDQKARVAHFVPHVERALRISQLLEFRAAQAADLMAAVESLPTGLVVVNADLRVRGINPAAERLMRETGALSLGNGRLRAPGAESGARLSQALAACLGARLDRAGASVLFPTRDGGAGLLVQIVPLPRMTTARRGDAVAAVFLSAPAEPGVAPIEAFVQRYGLTPSETRVLLAILRGETPRGIAAANGLALPTIRTHLSRLFDKTATSGQTDLVRLVTSLTAASGA